MKVPSCTDTDTCVLHQEYETIRSTYEKKAEQLEAEPATTSREMSVVAGSLSADVKAREVDLE